MDDDDDDDDDDDGFESVAVVATAAALAAVAVDDGGGSMESYTTRFLTEDCDNKRFASCSIMEATRRSRATCKTSGCSGTQRM